MAKRAPKRKPPRTPTLVYRPKGIKQETSRQRDVSKGK